MKDIPAYKRIQRDLMNAIADGTYPPGAKVATEAELMVQYSVSRITAQRALSELQQHGILKRRPRVGTVVARPPESAVHGANAFAQEARGSIIRLALIAPFDMAIGHTYQYLDGVMSIIEPSRDHLSLHNTRNQVDMERTLLQNALGGGADGIIYYPSNNVSESLDILMRITAFHMPCVVIDKSVSGVCLPCVKTDNVQATNDMVRRALKRGLKRFCFLANTSRTASCWERYFGFCQALAEARQTEREATYILYDAADMDGLIRLIKNQQIDCICCSTDYVAMQLMTHCRRVGIAIPEELSIVGFDGVYPGVIASMVQPYANIGVKAAEILTRWVMTGETIRETTTMKARFVDGESLKKASSIE